MTTFDVTNSTNPVRSKSTVVANAVWVVLLNIPFIIGHPVLSIDSWALIRSLAINAVLFLAPGWACLAPSGSLKPGTTLRVLGVVLISTGAFIGVLGGFQLAEWPVTGHSVWNATWLLTNLLLGVRLVWFQTSFVLRHVTNKSLLVAVVLFAASYPLYFVGATRVVPPQLDHDFEVQGTGLGLLQRMEPLLLTDRGTYYYFAHPPLLHFHVAASFLYFDATEHLELYDAASQRVRALKRDEQFTPLQGSIGVYEIVGRMQNDYVLRAADGSVSRVPLDIFELELIEEHYLAAPHQLETRTPTIFLAALTVAMLGWWTTRLTGFAPWGLLTGAAYATSPEVFVRSSYGGYFGVSNFAVLAILWTVSAWNDRRRRPDHIACLLAGFFAAVANHKLILLPVALAVYEFGRQVIRTNFKTVFGVWLVEAPPTSHEGGLPRPQDRAICSSQRQRRQATAFLHPSLVGFLVGTAVFWLYGLLISPSEFWTEHVRTHLFDRLAHINPLGYTGYPTMTGLWHELLEHTGYVLLPLACVALLEGTLRGTAHGRSAAVDSVSTTTMRGWFVWIVVTAAVFTMVDWRMTKHLMVLMLPLFLIPVIWAQRGRVAGWIAGLAMTVTLGWNLYTLQELVTDFGAFRISPGW